MLDLRNKKSRDQIQPLPDLNVEVIRIIARTRNLVLFSKTDTRPRSQYIHILRSLKKEIRDLISPNDFFRKDFDDILDLIKSADRSNQIAFAYLIDVFQAIPEKVGTSETREVIDKIRNLYEEYEPESTKEGPEEV